MHIKKLYLRNFRNYKEIEVIFSPTINIIYGENAQGKTNLLEALFLFSIGRSFRTHHLHELIREQESFFFLEAEIVRENISHTIKLSCDGQNRHLQLDANTYSHFHPLLGLLPLVLYIPADEELISGSPAVRRRLLNFHLAQSDPLYVHHLRRYTRAKAQRNALLKAKTLTAIDCWEAEMATSAAYLLQKRNQLIEELKLPLEIQSQLLSQSKEIHEIRFHPSTSPNYLQQLQKNRRKEKELGLTLTGPHRDDLSFWIDGKASRSFASEGQKKTATSALRLAEWHRLASTVGEKPLFAIDDFGLPLDNMRQKLFRNCLKELGQVFITTPSLQSEWKGHHCIHIENGFAKIQYP